MFAVFAAIILALAAAIAALLASLVVLAAIAGVAVLVNMALAGLIMTRRPPTRVWMSRFWWAAITIVLGPVSLLAFLVLHYRSGAPARCPACGYALNGVPSARGCPECGASAVRRL